jgi:dipeptidyl-peptidase-3
MALLPTKSYFKKYMPRYEKLNMAPYTGFVQPTLTAVTNSAGDIIDVHVNYNSTFLSQMIMYGKNYSFLDTNN